MSRRLPVLLLQPALLAVLVGFACAGGSGEPPEAVPRPFPTGSLDLATASPLLSILPADAEDLGAGASPLASGDFNGDGLPDLLIGVSSGDGPDNSRSEAGEAYVIFGSRDLGAEIDLAQGGAQLIIYGARDGDNLGFSVSSGDLNDDGIDDIIVGAPASNGLQDIRTDLGEVYVVFGSRDLGGTVDIAKSEQDVSVIAAEGFARLGTSFAVGDINEDGVDDLIAGAPFAGREPGSPPGGPRTTLGEVYVVFGSSGLSGAVDVAADEQDLSFSGVQEMGTFGQGVALGDVNGDGRIDIIVTAKGMNGPGDTRLSAGAAYVFFGSQWSAEKVASSEADLTVLGIDARDALGDSVGSGDLNGDGISDIVLASSEADGPRNSRELSGEAYVIFGSTSAEGVIDLASSAPGATIHGADVNDLLASSLILVDMNADDLVDIMLGAPFAAGEGNGKDLAGEAYAISGAKVKGIIDLGRDLEDAFVVFGGEPAGRLGSALAVLDINGDGVKEAVLAAPGASGADGPTGRLYVVRLP